jgi:hypothetical protein
MDDRALHQNVLDELEYDLRFDAAHIGVTSKTAHRYFARQPRRPATPSVSEPALPRSSLTPSSPTASGASARAPVPST